MEDRNVIVIQNGMDSYVFVHDSESSSLVSPKASVWAADPDLPSFKWSNVAVAARDAIMGSPADPSLYQFKLMVLDALDRDRAKRSEISGTA